MKSISVWMPSDPTIRVIGSQDISLTMTFWSRGVSTVLIALSPSALRAYQRFWYPVVSVLPFLRHSGSFSNLVRIDRLRPQRSSGP